jgi:hypothetical protein
MTVTVLHVARAFSAQPTLGEFFPDALVLEMPLPEALAAPRSLQPDVVWLSSATTADVATVRRRFPTALVLATALAGSSAERDLVTLIGAADLVLDDEGIVLAAAGLQALCRRRLLTPA